MATKKSSDKSSAKRAKASSTAVPGALSPDHDKWVAQLAKNQPELARSFDLLCREQVALANLISSLPGTIGSRCERNDQLRKAEFAGRSWNLSEVLGGQTALAKQSGLAAPRRPSENPPAALPITPSVPRTTSASKAG